METVNHQQAERETQRMRANREELVERIARAVPADGIAEPLECLHLARSSVSLEQIHTVLEPSFCVIAQGSKEVLLGNSRYRYDSSHYLIVTVDLPYTGQILEASRERPYLSLRLELAPSLVGSLMVEAGFSSPPGHVDVRAMDVGLLDLGLQDCVVRLVRLLELTAGAPVLMPLITREITFRLLIGNQGARLRHLVTLQGYAPDITRAVERLRSDFDRPIRVEDLARELGMSVSGLHHHFRAVTGTSPLQFQKQLRLQEARRLILIEDHGAASAAYPVGYHDASHFSREYKGLFGRPPMRDAQRLREAARRSTGT